VARGIDDVDRVAFPVDGGVFGLDGDALLAFEVHRVHGALGGGLVFTIGAAGLRSWSTRVVLPWSTWAMMARLRIFKDMEQWDGMEPPCEGGGAMHGFSRHGKATANVRNQCSADPRMRKNARPGKDRRFVAEAGCLLRKARVYPGKNRLGKSILRDRCLTEGTAGQASGCGLEHRVN
jgi:hypothetical protein